MKRGERLEWVLLLVLLLVALLLLGYSVWRFVPCGGAALFCP